MTTDVYLAGSVFSTFERSRNRRLSSSLGAQGWTVFLPQDISDPTGRRPSRIEIFEACRQGIVDARLVVAILDGPDVDSGTAWEVGYAHALGKPIVGLRADYRGAEGGPVNIMLEFSTKLLLKTEPRVDESVVVSDLVDLVRQEL